jgi:hypothetical protein
VSLRDIFINAAKGRHKLSLLLEATFRWTVASGAERRVMGRECEMSRSDTICGGAATTQAFLIGGRWPEGPDDGTP